MGYERIGEDLKRKAKEADLVSYLKARHPKLYPLSRTNFLTPWTGSHISCP